MIDAHLEGIRERRLRAYKVYQQLEQDRKEAEDEKTREKIAKACEMLLKEIERVDAAIDKVELRTSKIRALRLQLGVGM